MKEVFYFYLFVVYATMFMLKKITELEFPQGASTINPPPLLLSSEIFSPNCWFLLSSSKQPGIKIEKYYSKAVTYAGIASVIAVIQIFSLIHQMEHTPTPSVSYGFFYCIDYLTRIFSSSK